MCTRPEVYEYCISSIGFPSIVSRIVSEYIPPHHPVFLTQPRIALSSYYQRLIAASKDKVYTLGPMSKNVQVRARDGKASMDFCNSTWHPFILFGDPVIRSIQASSTHVFLSVNGDISMLTHDGEAVCKNLPGLPLWFMPVLMATSVRDENMLCILGNGTVSGPFDSTRWAGSIVLYDTQKFQQIKYVEFEPLSGLQSGMAFDGTEFLYTLNSFEHSIQQISLITSKVRCFGCQGSGAGQLLTPNDVVLLPNDFLVVADHENCRLQVFRAPDCEFVSVHQLDVKPWSLAYCDGTLFVFAFQHHSPRNHIDVFSVDYE